MKMLLFVAALGLITACSAQKSAPADAFMEAIRIHCGKAYAGRVISTDEIDADFASEALIMEVRECRDTEIRIPFHVGDDHSRTWVLSRTDAGLRLKHDHRHEDGSEDAVTQYGGDSATVTSSRAEFPVDQFSIDLFTQQGLTASVTNVWAVDVTDEFFAYELSRENRFFRVEFDFESPTHAPPPWGAED